MQIPFVARGTIRADHSRVSFLLVKNTSLATRCKTTQLITQLVGNSKYLLVSVAVHASLIIFNRCIRLAYNNLFQPEQLLFDGLPYTQLTCENPKASMMLYDAALNDIAAWQRLHFPQHS